VSSWATAGQISAAPEKRQQANLVALNASQRLLPAVKAGITPGRL